MNTFYIAEFFPRILYPPNNLLLPHVVVICGLKGAVIAHPSEVVKEFPMKSDSNNCISEPLSYE
jgi:hypothetical protein